MLDKLVMFFISLFYTMRSDTNNNVSYIIALACKDTLERLIQLNDSHLDALMIKYDIMLKDSDSPKSKEYFRLLTRKKANIEVLTSRLSSLKRDMRESNDDKPLLTYTVRYCIHGILDVYNVDYWKYPISNTRDFINISKSLRVIIKEMNEIGFFYKFKLTLWLYTIGVGLIITLFIIGHISVLYIPIIVMIMGVIFYLGVLRCLPSLKIITETSSFGLTANLEIMQLPNFTSIILKDLDQ